MAALFDSLIESAKLAGVPPRFTQTARPRLSSIRRNEEENNRGLLRLGVIGALCDPSQSAALH